MHISKRMSAPGRIMGRGQQEPRRAPFSQGRWLRSLRQGDTTCHQVGVATTRG